MKQIREFKPGQITECPNCHNVGDHVRLGWHGRHLGVDKRLHLCDVCGYKWTEFCNQNDECWDEPTKNTGERKQSDNLGY